MATDIWGYQGGRRQANIDDAALRKAALDAESTQLSNDAAMVTLKQNQAFLEAISGDATQGKVTSEDGIPAHLTTLAEAAMGAGLVDKRETARHRRFHHFEPTVSGEEKGILTKKEAAQYLSNLYAGVKTEEEWKNANEIYANQYGEMPFYSKYAFSPELVKTARMAATSDKERAQIALTQANTELAELRQSTEKARKTYIGAQTDLAEERRKHVAKGGSTIVPPAYISAVTKEIKDRFIDLDEREMGAMALPIAEAAWGYVTNEGLSLSQAVKKATDEAEEGGQLGGLEPLSSDPLIAGSRADNPLDLPMTKQGKIDVAKLEKNKFYRNADDEVIYVNKRGEALLLEDDDDAEAVAAGDEEEE